MGKNGKSNQMRNPAKTAMTRTAANRMATISSVRSDLNRLVACASKLELEIAGGGHSEYSFQNSLQEEENGH